MEQLYTDQFPLNNKKLNIPYLLHSRNFFPPPKQTLANNGNFVDINHPANAQIIPEFCESTLDMRVLYISLSLSHISLSLSLSVSDYLF